MKSIELIGLFNEFSEGALVLLTFRHLSDTDVSRYMKIYHEWLGHSSSTSKEDQEQANILREEMKGLEELVSAEEIVSLRQLTV